MSPEINRAWLYTSEKQFFLYVMKPNIQLEHLKSEQNACFDMLNLNSTLNYIRHCLMYFSKLKKAEFLALKLKYLT